MTVFIILIFGLIVGSFLNMVIYRLHSGGSMIFARSKCPHCKTELAALDLVPVFSFIFLRGKCAHCAKKISWQYPIVEIITGMTFVLLFLNFSAGGGSLPAGQAGAFGGQYWFELFLASVFIVVAGFDLKHYLILDKVIFPVLGIVLIRNFLSDLSTGIWSIGNGYFLSGIIGAGIIAGFFFLQYIFSKGRWIGFGDVKYGLLLGAFAGFELSLVLLMVAYILGAFVGLGLIAINKKQLSSKLPFGTFLSASAIIVMLAGDKILNWYLKLIGY